MTDTLLCLLSSVAAVANDPVLQTVSAVATGALFYFMRGVAHVTSNPTVILYTLQATIYAIAAFLSLRAEHKDLTACYAGSSCIHGLLGACYSMRLE